MKYLDFNSKLNRFEAFTWSDIKKLSPKVYSYQLNSWQKKGLIKRIANEVYSFNKENIDEKSLFFYSNLIYNPSYISLESALSYYGFIPESVYGITGITTNKTYKFETEQTTYLYKSIKPALFWGYKLLQFNDVFIKIAEPEKALLDFLYFNKNLKTKEHLDSFRLNYLLIKEKISIDKFTTYLKYYNIIRLSKLWNFINIELNNA